ESAFLNSKIDIRAHLQGRHNILFDFYRTLIDFRRRTPALRNLLKENMDVRRLGEKGLFVRRWFGKEDVFSVYNFDKSPREMVLNIPSGRWTKELDSSSEEWGGEGEAAPKLIESSGSEIVVCLNLCGFALYRMVVCPDCTDA
ncbi:MAG TPA: DUF3459 domain-containing protein, partial [Thermodesulfovibrionales bacterium]|nr:DUF3459 domain-containing protein [Thermodesulfovibrionales bacterium]